MLNEMQLAITFPSLAALLENPDFRSGLQDAPQVFADYDEPVSTEAEMIEVVERNLSRRARTRDGWLCRLLDTGPPSYLYALGLVVGLINEGCLHAH